MFRKLFFLAFLLLATSAQAATAIWTGRSEQITTVTYQQAWRCEYNYMGHYFWRTFRSYCASQVEVE